MLGPDEFQVQTRHCATKQVTGPKHPFSDFGVADPDRESYF
jgi:hypothetical protein